MAHWRKTGGIVFLVVLAAAAIALAPGLSKRFAKNQSTHNGSVRDAARPEAGGGSGEAGRLEAGAPKDGAAKDLRWGNALNSAAFDGKGFFERGVSAKFLNSIEPKLRAYVVQLNSRYFLPLGLDDAAAKELFGERTEKDAGLKTVYMQFLQHPDDAQRAQLKAAGVELLAYKSNYAWTARGTEDDLLAAANLPFVRTLAQIDPRDKLHVLVYLEQTPAYAQTPAGDARFTLLAQPGVSAAAMQAAVASAPGLAQATVTPQTPSVLGPTFEVTARANQALALAALDHTAFIQYISPPVAPRDVTTDTSSNIGPVRDFGPKLDGTGVTVAVREIGKPESHVDFINRVTFVDNDGDTTTQDVPQHATAVTGQIASSGVNQPAAKGVAPNCQVLIYSLMDGAFATADVVDAAKKGSRVSNHSYGPVGPGGGVLPVYGDYEVDSANWDGAIHDNNLLCFFAGNEESDAANVKHIDFFVGMKNGLCIEASSAQAMAGPPSADGSAFFAKYGPMNDGRVKPDLVAFGDNVTLDTGINGTISNTGTSFSTPACTGVATLVFQHYKTVFGSEPSAAAAKALLCETAADLGQPGPDYIYGFGIVDASAAINLIDSGSGGGASPFVEGTVNNGATQSFALTIPPNTQNLKATLCWMDTPGDPSAAKALVNDLDLLLIDPNGTQHFPYSLDPNNPTNAATNSGPNTVDPIEQTIIQNPIAGTWTVKIIGTSIPGGSQAYAFCSNTILSRPLIAFAQASPTQGTAPLDVTFSAAGSVGNIASYNWNFGDGTTGTGIEITHTYKTVGSYTASLVIVDIGGKSAKPNNTITITVGKPTIQVFPYKAVGKVNLNKSSACELDASMIVTSLVSTAQQARDAIANGVYEGKQYTVSVGLIDPNTGQAVPQALQTFLVDRHASDLEKSEQFKINLQKGMLQIKLKTHPNPANPAVPIRDMAQVFKGLGIDGSVTSPYTFTMRVTVETDDVIYQADFQLTYTGKNGSGTVK
ncbi:MAG TPA: S8 family serine peptidase [Planctomycetota bacterium]|nr:S8 family serine peptidase [Planctomycetota bacterium]